MWYKPVNESSIATPSVLLFPDRIEQNIHRMIAIAGNAERMRPHVKTHKIKEVISLQLQQGISRFKCATLSEVEMVASAGGKDILLSYPLLGPALGIWFNLTGKFPDCKMSVTVDSETALGKLSKLAQDKGKRTDVFVDLDNGMHRTGIDPGSARKLIHSISKNRDLHFRGLHIYDGHIHEVDPELRKEHCDRDFEGVNRLVEKLVHEGIEVHELACGGTPTFPIHATYPSRSLCPGTPLLWDAGYTASIPDLEFLPAAVVAGRIISKPEGQLCLDLGYKSIASEMNHPRVHFMELKVDGVINHSEEHLVISSGDAIRYRIGDVVYALPTHICPTIALHEEVYVVRNRHVTGTWKVIARKRAYPL
jgi:D-serine deaminase-like pyridoxal phosphate-dependent protein